MSIVHGSWIILPENSYFFLWGETWRPLSARECESAVFHPFNLGCEDLLSFFQSSQLQPEKFLNQVENTITPETLNGKWQTEVVSLPSYRTDSLTIIPLLSKQTVNEECTLYSWQVEGLRLNPLEAVKFLQLLPLGTLESNYLGGDLRFWSYIYRWSLDLLARSKFLPGISQNNGIITSCWQPLLDSSADISRFAKFTKLMPSACRAYQHLGSQIIEPEELLLGGLKTIVDTQVRSWVEVTPETTAGTAVPKWLRSINLNSSVLTIESEELTNLVTALDNWKLPVEEYLITGSNKLTAIAFRTCLVLEPPTAGNVNWGYVNWKLKYYLQALDEPDFLIFAEDIWQNPVEELIVKGRTLEKPQETLLKGLGFASRIYAPIEASLQEKYPLYCELDPIGVYEFIRAYAWQLQDNGIGVILPPGLAEGKGQNRLGIKINAQVKQQKKTERLGIKTLLKYELNLAVGDKIISQKDFERMLAQKSPIVEVDGEWIALQPADVKAAQAILDKSNEEMTLSVEDALRLSTGETKILAKLPVVGFEAAGILQELIKNINNNQSLEPIKTPPSFKGKLRPYQARGVSWLAFLENWGLGACLADDMGLGKCVLHLTTLEVNGKILTAEEIWKNYAGATEYDGEGFWAQPKKVLLVNSLDEQSGKIVQATIERLYRQQVRETVKKIKLKDGNSITITKRHKLLTHENGWTNNFQVGDYICVPAKTIWSGKPEDHNLIKFIAWQIAEGYEHSERSALTITQKDPAILEELLVILHSLSKKYEIKINKPVVRPRTNKTAADLILHSRSYQSFLEAKGYQWGKKSKEKSIPPFIMQADLKSVSIFLSNYFDAEGSVINSMRSVEISTASELIIQQLSVLLRRFGIWLRIASKQKCATNGTGIYRNYYIGTLGGNSARRFLEEIGFNNPEKQQKLEKICEKVSNTNVEGIPASKIVAQAVKTTKLPLRHLGMHNTVYINGSQQFSRPSLEKVVSHMELILTGVTEEKYRLQKPSKWTAQTLEAYSLLDKQKLEANKQKLQDLLDKEVFYCQIEDIEEFHYEGWVYDFEVKKHHNFVANNILCHNTIQTIAFFLNLKEEGGLKAPTLLVCPTSVLNNWEREVQKFAPSLTTLIHHGANRKQGKDFVQSLKNIDVVITSYALVPRDEKTLQQVKWQGVVIDEAQNIKNPQAKQSIAVRELKAGFRIALTGTPVENRLSELWSILEFLNPGFLGSRQFFQKRFAIPIEKYGDRESLTTLRSLVQPFILRRLKTDKNIIQDLPEKQEMNVYCGLSLEQASLYQQLVDESLQAIDVAEGIKRRGLILTLLMQLKQVCNHPAQYLQEKSLTSAQRSGKLLRLEEMLEEAIASGDGSDSNPGKALIFTQFAEWGKLLQPYLEKKLGVEILFLYGAIALEKRVEMVDRFQNDPQGPPIFILSLKAGGTGLNLTRANHVFHFDRWWNPAVEDQATDRAFRIGQMRNVQVHKFVCTGTLEERISDMLATKKQLAEQTVDTGENWLTELDTEQLRNLLLLDRDQVIDD